MSWIDWLWVGGGVIVFLCLAVIAVAAFYERDVNGKDQDARH